MSGDRTVVVIQLLLGGHGKAGGSAAAAHRHDEVRAGRLELIHQLLHLHIGGLRRQIGDNDRLLAGLLQLCQRQIHQTGAQDPAVREDGHLLGVLHDGFQIFQCVHAAVNGARHGHAVFFQ